MGMISTGFRAAGSLLAPGERGSSLRILFFHGVLSAPDPLQPLIPHAQLFDSQMALIGRTFSVLPLQDAVERLAAGTLPARALSITFDDGYRNNFEIAYPILRRRKLTATFFITSGHIDHGLMYNDVVLEVVRRLPEGVIDLTWAGLGPRRIQGLGARCALVAELTGVIKYMTLPQREQACERLRGLVKESLPQDLMMASEQIRGLAKNGMSIGGHTLTHPILSTLSKEEARVEIERDRAALACLLDEAPTSFAYPNGKPGIDFHAEHVELAQRAGYRIAVTTAWGVARPSHSRMELPRLCLQEHGPLGFIARLLFETRAAVTNARARAATDSEIDPSITGPHREAMRTDAAVYQGALRPGDDRS